MQVSRRSPSPRPLSPPASSSSSRAQRRIAGLATHLQHTPLYSTMSNLSVNTASHHNDGPHALATASPTEEEYPSPPPGAAALSSRQIPLFQQGNTQLEKADKLDIMIDTVKMHSIPRIHDFLPEMPSYPNRFARTKASIMHSQLAANSPTQPPPGVQIQSAGTRQVQQQQYRPPLVPGVTAAAAPPGCPSELTYQQYIKEGDVVLLDIVRRSGLGKNSAAKSFVRAGPREQICWAPGEAVAAIVTCGGLCPGLNDVIAELFNTLYYNYGVNRIHGIRCGFRGIWDPRFYPWIDLTPENIRGIDTIGGTILGSSRGGFKLDAIMQACINRGVNQLYIVGGDGTHRAADIIQNEIKMTVACVPKTIDNDIGVIDRSFGFNTAVHEARKAIQSAVVEASCAPNGLGIVQLMGRHAGYIAAHATLASRQVDLCLIPELSFPLEGPYGVLALTEEIIRRQGYGVIVVAEGAGADLLPSHGTDESGNPKLPEIGKYLQSCISQHFKERKLDVSIKYHDPSYMIRSVPADASDSVYCMTLAQNCVHGAMAGYTGFTSGLVNNRTVMLPIPVITATSPSYLNPDGRTWERVVGITHQPSSVWSQMAEERRKEQAARAQQELAASNA